MSRGKKTRGPKAKYILYGGKPVTAVVDGKLTGVRHDKGCDSHFCFLPDPSDSNAPWKKRNLGRDVNKAVPKFYALVRELKKEPHIPRELICKQIPAPPV